tara:strand:+ start:745 stop:1011 length:267 start_codon:yes stop_codon:yes gene_type:complete
MELTRLELCEALAIDYARRATVLSLKFEEAYERYYKRCEIRSYDNLFAQFKHGKLLTKLSKTPLPALRTNEYIVSVSDDDCEDGVCKL